MRGKWAGIGVLAVVMAAFSGGVSARASTAVTEVPVTFDVDNVSDATQCTTDGGHYLVQGSLVGPTAKLYDGANDAVTLYTHGSGDGSAWHFPAPGVDHITEMAALGHVSVFIHSLGYGPSYPAQGIDGSKICVGSVAHTVDQVITALRTGTYHAPRSGLPRFERVALVGHSGGAIISELAAVTYHNFDALVLAGWADMPTTFVPFYQGAADAGVHCLQGGEAKRPGGPAGYAKVFTKREWWDQLGYNTDPSIIDAFYAAYEDEPCGVISDFGAALARNAAGVHTLTAPVLLLYGDHDVVDVHEFPLQRALYTGSNDVSLAVIPDTGHMSMLGRTAPAYRAVLSGWLAARGF